MVTRTPSRATSLIALLVAVILLASACGDDSGDSDESATETTVTAEDTTTTTVAAGEAPSESPAASLRSDLAGLLAEGVYLTGFTVQAATVAGGDLGSPEAEALATEASESATELSEVVGAAYGTAAGAEFLEVWNAHRDAVIDTGLGNGTVGAVDAARQEVVDTLADLDPAAPLDGVTDGLEASDAALLTTIEELVAGTPAAAVDLRVAAAEMPDVAVELARNIVDLRAIEGDVDGPGAELRAELTGLLQESALLTGLALTETVQADGDSSAPGPAGALAAVDENTEALAQVMEPGDAAAAASFQRIWTEHVDAFADYATALVADDAEGIESAEAALAGFRDDLGALLAGSSPAFTEEAVAEELVPHVDSILAYTDALVAESGGEAETIESAGLLREAALAMRLAARTIAGGLTAPGA